MNQDSHHVLWTKFVLRGQLAVVARRINELTLSPESYDKFEKFVFKNIALLYKDQLVRRLDWGVFFDLWTSLGLLVVLFVLNWRWILIPLLVAFVLFYLPFFRKVGLILAKPLFRPLRAGVDY
jgi:hypothetical protein